jgi:hypothetical protein
MVLITRPTITYPAALDTIATLPKVADGVTAVSGSVHNNLRQAVINIEYELGVKPGGATPGTVRSRLDSLESIITKLNLNLQFGGDLEAQADPTIQHVIGIYGNPILHNDLVPITTGSSFRWDGYYWTEAKLYQDDILPPFFITINGPEMREVNELLPFPGFLATYNFDPPTSIILSDSDGYSKTIAEVDRFSFSSDNEYQKIAFDENVVFTLTAMHHGVTRTATHTITWGQKLYWGIGPAGYSTENDIKNNLDGYLTNTIDAEFTVTAGPTDKIYFACRSGYGTATFTVGGFDGGFTLTNTISLTNTYGFTESYDLYESDSLGLGTTTVTVS